MSIRLSVWKIHRRIGMSGGLFVNALLRETGMSLSAPEIDRLRGLHVEAYLRRFDQVRPLLGARELLSRLTGLGVPWAIATSGSLRTARPAVDLLGVPPSTILITREDVARAKPDPTFS